MPQKLRTICCGYDPILVRGYVRTGEQALWIYMPKELYQEMNVPTNTPVELTLHKVYDYEGNVVAEPEKKYTWNTSNNSGMSIVIPGEVITEFKLTAWHYLELTIEKIGGKDVYPGETKEQMWPMEKIKNPTWPYRLTYVE
ncbi:MAG: hypothetical protein ACE5K4_00185 [Candidatus Hydrothermarchaeota archaeon]